MRNNYYNFIDTSQIKYNRKLILKAMDNCVELMEKENLNDDMVASWVEYVGEILKLCVKNTQSNIYIVFLELKVTIESNNVKSFDKLRAYMDFLFEILEVYK